MFFCDYYAPDRLGHYAMHYDESVLTRKWNRLKRLENILVKHGREELLENYPKGYSFGCGDFDSQVQKIYNFEDQLDQVIDIYTMYVSSLYKEEKE